VPKFVADSVETTGLKWVAPAGGGKVLQVVSATTTTPTTIATTSMTDTTITATITPTLATSKILILLNGALLYKRSSTFGAIGANLLRDASVIMDYDPEGAMNLSVTGATYIELGATFAINYLDDPTTTSATTYKLQAKITQTANSGSSTWQVSNYPSTITLLEIGA
jgi:hypothetical protein